MKQDKIREQAYERNAPIEWQDDDAEWVLAGYQSLGSDQQEACITISRKPAEVDVYASHRSYITELKKNPYFKAEKIYCYDDGLIAVVQGKLPADPCMITIRKATSVIEPEKWWEH